MARRVDLHNELCAILGNSKNVYYQPPESVRLCYPAIVYSREDIDILHADNSPYELMHAYQVTLIDKNPDSEYVDKIARMPTCRFNRHYTADNLNHDVFVIYY